MTLSSAQLITLETLCRRVVPLPDVPAAALARAVEARLGTLHPGRARRVAGLLTLLDHPLAALAAGSPRRFTQMPPARQDAWLRSWETSRLPFRRSVFQALRRLVLSTHYADPAAARAIGCLGPLHERAPAFPWEGPLPGAPSDDEPVARSGRPGPRLLHLAPAQLDLMDDPWVRGMREGAQLGAETRVRADVCVVGTGAGGAVAAARLAAPGHEVVVLEEGGFWRAEQLSEQEREMTPRLYAEAALRATEDLAVPILQGRSVGGGTAVNWMIMLRTPEWVLEEWATRHGTVGMSAAELDGEFRRIEEETHTRAVPDDAHNPPNRALLDGAAALGWSAHAAAINARGCVRSGFCGLGCRYEARQGATAVHLPAALAAGARLFADVRADRVELAEAGGRAPLKRVHATVLDRETGAPRGRLVVEAPVVILAAGAVGTPALLQRSGMGGGGVGRFLRLHPTTLVVGTYDREMYPAAGIPLSAVCDEYLRGDDGYGFWIECPPSYPALAATALPGFGAPHRALMESFRALAPFVVLVRDGAATAVSNGDVSVGRNGQVGIRYRLGAAERARMKRGMHAAARIHFAAGAREVTTLHAGGGRLRGPADLPRIDRLPCGPNQLGVMSAHVNGTCRLGVDPALSGCTPDGERHGIPGLYVADGSLLPTAPGVNPQETIMAVASVVAARVAARHPAGRAGSAGALAGAA